jgi:hypothetical protein
MIDYRVHMGSRMSKLLFIDPRELHAHEAVRGEHIRRIVEMIRRTGFFHPPLLIDRESKVVLDGHHRLQASYVLGCREVPCYCVDYLKDDSVNLESWRPEISVTKEQVIAMGLSDDLYPFKTTRHRYVLPESIERTPLERLVGAR